jgi:hypothetical protein
MGSWPSDLCPGRLGDHLCLGAPALFTFQALLNPSLARFITALQRLRTGESSAPAPTVDPSAPPQ